MRRRVFYKFFSLSREYVQLFLCLKEKVAKRSRQAKRLIAVRMESAYRKAGSALRERLHQGAEQFAWRKGVAPLAALWGTLIAGKLFFWCAYGMEIPPKAYFSPAKYRKIVPPSLFYEIFAVIFAKAYWGLNNGVGIS